MPCTLCPRGYLHRIPCNGCDCNVSINIPMPYCGETSFTLPCVDCGDGCPYFERHRDIEEAAISGKWWNGNDEMMDWGEPPANHSRKSFNPIGNFESIEDGKPSEPEFSDWLKMDQRRRESQHLDGLNADQYQVATHVNGPVVVIAGAGSGKTKSVVARMANLIRVEGIPGNNILAITFTRKAADEMRERAIASLGEDDKLGLQVRTFHSTGVRICRSYSRMMNLRDRFSVWDEEASKRQAKIAIQEVIEVSEDPKGRRSYTPGMLLGLLGGWKERGLEMDQKFWQQLEMGGDARIVEIGRADPNAIEGMREKIAEIGGGDKTAQEGRLKRDLDELAQAIRKYEELKRTIGALDLSDLIWMPVVHARTNEALRVALGERWSHIIVDEYQDTNDLQEELIHLLGGSRRNVMVVGDDDQSIYGWRGSNVSLITGFTHRWEGSRMIRLGQNYRCRPEIVKAADASIRRNSERVSKNLWSEREEGGSVRTIAAPSPWDEVSIIRREIEKKIASGVPKSSIAVLCRRRMGVSQVSAELTKFEVPNEAVGVRPWYRQPDVATILSHLRYQTNPNDIDAAQDILASWYGIGATTIKNWHNTIEKGEQRLLDEPLLRLTSLPRHGEKTSKGRSILQLRQMHKELAESITQQSPLKSCEKLIRDSGIEAEIEAGVRSEKASLAREARDRQVAIGHLIDCAGKAVEIGLDGLAEMLDNISTLVSIQESASERVVVSTIHSAKGLEWNHVIVMGLNQTIFPTGDNIEEERRLFYVALTRAKEDLTLTYSLRTRTPYGEIVPAEASQFIHEAEESGTIKRGGWSH